MTLDPTQLNSQAWAKYALDALHPNWQANIKPSVWGRGKATVTDKKLCPDTAITGDQSYQGNCDSCRYFLGCRFESREYSWGDRAPGCCGLLLHQSLQEQGVSE